MNKLDQYSLMSLAFLAGINGSKINAQVIQYHNFNPDIVLDPNDPVDWQYELDMSMDGEHDFRFMLENSQTFSDSGAGSFYTWFYNATVIPYNNGGLLVENDLVGSTDFPLVFNYGENINAGLNTWFDNADGIGECCLGFVRLKNEFNPAGILIDSDVEGYWLYKTGKFIAARVKIDDELHYGWIRVSVDDKVSSLTIHDFAFNESPDDPIFAGETGLDCNAPFQLAPVSNSPTVTTVKWQPVSGAEVYKLKYRVSGPGSWTTVSLDAPKKSKKLTGLNCNTEYQWKISASCDGGTTFSEFSDVKKFTTGECRFDNNDEIKPEISFYPNPASELLYIDMDGISENTVIEIFDINGKLIQVISATANEFITLNVSEFNGGLYLLNIQGSSVSIKNKFIIQ